MVGITIILAAAVVANAAPTPLPTPAAAARMAAAGGISKATEPTPRGHSLADVARNVKLRFPASKPLVITNDSLKELSAGAELTTGAPVPPSADSSGTSTYEQELATKKTYWQDRYFAAQRELSDLESEEKRLTAEVARLERDFYSRDDPYQRDNVIKPAWDDATAKLRDVQKRLGAARSAPNDVADQARRDGALPGWFREAPPPTPAAAGGRG
jgi:hypothetical protein